MGASLFPLIRLVSVPVHNKQLWDWLVEETKAPTALGSVHRQSFWYIVVNVTEQINITQTKSYQRLHRLHWPVGECGSVFSTLCPSHGWFPRLSVTTSYQNDSKHGKLDKRSTDSDCFLFWLFGEKQKRRGCWSPSFRRQSFLYIVVDVTNQTYATKTNSCRQLKQVLLSIDTGTESPNVEWVYHSWQLSPTKLKSIQRARTFERWLAASTRHFGIWGVCGGTFIHQLNVCILGTGRARRVRTQVSKQHYWYLVFYPRSL